MTYMIYICRDMDTKAFSFNSQAKYRTGRHFKEKTALSLANQEIMVYDQGSFNFDFYVSKIMHL